ncbi:MAG: hypothetical protein K2G21_00305 [Muribaculaceae bacterium]|nr:hypothetical protein [Muribaculaceae bacterium]
MIDESLKILLDTPADTPIDPQLVASLTERCPAFLLPVVLELRHPHPGLDEATAARLVDRIALSVPDRRRVRVLIDPEGTGRYDRFYPVQQVDSSPSTSDAIDTFLSTYGNIDPAEEALLNRMIFNPVPDYAATLERETPVVGEPRDEQDRMLDAFIAGSADFKTVGDGKNVDGEIASGDGTVAVDATHDEVPRPPKAPAGSLLSESLAKIFIKQHNYKRAYEIISSLSLNYPEKSIYFADQLRFLRKLIANQEARERQNKQ